MGKLFRLILLLNILASTCIAQERDGSFKGTWQYKSDNYLFNIKINELSDSSLIAQYSVVAENGAKLDTPDEDASNIEFVRLDKSTKTLKVKLKSNYSGSIHYATFKLVDQNTLEYSLGDAIIDDTYLYPYLKTILKRK